MNCVAYNSPLELAATGGIDGRVQFWDMRQKASVHDLMMPGSIPGSLHEVTAL